MKSFKRNASELLWFPYKTLSWDILYHYLFLSQWGVDDVTLYMWHVLDTYLKKVTHSAATHGNSTLQFCLNMSFLWLYPLDQTELNYLTCWLSRIQYSFCGRQPLLLHLLHPMLVPLWSTSTFPSYVGEVYLLLSSVHLYLAVLPYGPQAKYIQKHDTQINGVQIW